MSPEFLMARRGVIGLLMGSVAVLGLGGCGSRRRFNYKMTVEVDTPEGIRSGHTVREIRYSGNDDFAWRLPIWFGESRPQWRLKGEAVAVVLPGGKTLFALLINGAGQVDYAGRDIWKLMKNEPEAKDGILELWPNMPTMPTLNPIYKKDRILPMLVTFRDIADPASVERVDPGNLAATFGPGVRLRRITVEVTDDDVSKGIEKQLVKLGIKPNHGLDEDFKSTTQPTLAQQLGYSDFYKEQNR